VATILEAANEAATDDGSLNVELPDMYVAEDIKTYVQEALEQRGFYFEYMDNEDSLDRRGVYLEWDSSHWESADEDGTTRSDRESSSSSDDGEYSDVDVDVDGDGEYSVDDDDEVIEEDDEVVENVRGNNNLCLVLVAAGAFLLFLNRMTYEAHQHTGMFEEFNFDD